MLAKAQTAITDPQQAALIVGEVVGHLSLGSSLMSAIRITTQYAPMTAREWSEIASTPPGAIWGSWTHVGTVTRRLRARKREWGDAARALFAMDAAAGTIGSGALPFEAVDSVEPQPADRE